MQAQVLRPRVGLLALTLELYETLAPGVRASRERWLQQEVVPALSKQNDVLFQTAVYTRETIDSTVSQHESAGADVLLVVLLTYSPSQLALPALQRTRVPIVIWNTQELFAVDASFTQAQMIDNHGVHGTQDLSNVLRRAGVRFHYVTSHLRNPNALEELNQYLNAAAVAKRVRQARIGVLGHAFPGMGDFAIDTTRMVATLGAAWIHVPIEDYLQRSTKAEAAAVAKLIEEYRKEYEVAPDLTPGDLDACARAEIALRALVKDHRLDALTYQFMAFGEDERSFTLPFVAASRLMAEGVGFGGEGDLVGALGTSLLNWLQPPASFSEIFTIDFAGNSLFLSHMGEANVALARRDRKISLVARPTPITRTRDRQLALVTSFQPGEATLMALTQTSGQQWRLITAKVTIENYGPLASMCVPHFKLKTGGDVRDFLTAYANAGGPHHNAICFGDARRTISLLAEIMGIDYRGL